MLQKKENLEKTLSSKLLDEQKKKIVRLIEKGNTKKALSLIDGMSKKLSDNPEFFAKNILYIVERISDDKIKKNLLQFFFQKEDVLKNHGCYEILFEIYEQALKIDCQNRDILFSYGNILYENGEYEKAIEQYKHILDFQPDDYESWHNYGMNLVKLKRYEEAIEKYEKSLQIKTDNYKLLNNYGLTLLKLERYSEAIDIFKKILAIESENNDFKLMSFLVIGIICCRIKDETQADKYFKLAIEHVENQDAARIFIAQNIFASSPYSQQGIDILKEIPELSRKYSQASDMLSLNLSLKEYWEMFNPRKNSAELRDNEMLNRAIYHKIKNEISILKAIVYEIISDYQGTDSTFRNIIDNINHIFKEIEQRRNIEKQQIREFPSNEYEKIIKIISDTAHDISDFVNNELAIIEADVRDLLSDLNPDNPLCKILQELLTQIKITQGALNDLKAINEGIRINQSGFYVKELFENWEKTQKLQHASILSDIENGESFFYGDKQKIKGFLNELVDNAIKHNPDKKDLEIRIWSKDEINLSPIFPDDIVGRHLLIGCSDNGKGIPSDKKKTIFLPLETTSNTGSGLGLFIIKRTLKEMKGYIQETGEHGANFEIYIPYNKGATPRRLTHITHTAGTH